MEIHPQRAPDWHANTENRANADFSEQAVDFKGEIRAHFVIVLSCASSGAGRDGGEAVFSTKLSTTFVSVVLRPRRKVLRISREFLQAKDRDNPPHERRGMRLRQS
jgi:hypothetical protein